MLEIIGRPVAASLMVGAGSPEDVEGRLMDSVESRIQRG